MKITALNKKTGILYYAKYYGGCYKLPPAASNLFVGGKKYLKGVWGTYIPVRRTKVRNGITIVN